MRKVLVFVCLLAFLVLGCEGPYGPDGYNQRGYNAFGYDRDGYDKNGRDSWGNLRPRAAPVTSVFAKGVEEDNLRVPTCIV